MNLPTSVPYGPLLIVLGVILMLNPLYIGMLDLDQIDRYRYQASQVTFTDSHVESDTPKIDRDVACLYHDSRRCMLEHYVKRNDGVNDSPEISALPGSGYEYAYLDGEFYRVQPQSPDRNGTLSLEYQEREAALRDISTPVERTPPAIRTAVRTGNVTVDHELAKSNELIRDGEEYYVVHKHSDRYPNQMYEQERRKGQRLQGGLTIVGIAVGLWLVLRGQRHRILG